jgi:hypothetical protein
MSRAAATPITTLRVSRIVVIEHEIVVAGESAGSVRWCAARQLR